MGKGDRKTKKGKITKGTFGVRRPHKIKKASEVVAAKPVKKATKAKPKAKKKKTEES